MPQVRRLRVVNPNRKRSRRNRRKRNMGGGELLIMTNPKRKRSSRRRRSKGRAKNAKRNPFMKRRTSRRHSRRNPSIGGFQSNELLKLALGAAAGSIGTKWLADKALGSNNTGMTGYLGSAAAAVALGWAASKFAGKDIANGVIAGGLGAIVVRYFQENISGTSPAAMSGYLGDPDMSGNALGDYKGNSYAVPFNYGGPVALPAGSVSAAQAAGAMARASAARGR